jgi:hypothetical protein
MSMLGSIVKKPKRSFESRIGEEIYDTLMENHNERFVNHVKEQSVDYDTGEMMFKLKTGELIKVSVKRLREVV